MKRRDVIKTVAATGIAMSLPRYTWANSNGSKLKVGLVGCSGRGLAAVGDMLQAANGSVQIVAIADLFPDRIVKGMENLEKKKSKFGPDSINVPKERQFVGWDAYKQILTTDLDVIIHATPPVFRPLHLREFVNAGKHLFVEKPACVDPVQARELLEIAEIADKKGLSIIPGIQRRFHHGYQEAVKRIQDGEIGEIVSGNAAWLNSRFFIQNGGKLNLNCTDPEEMEYQIRNWFIFTWASGDCYVEQHVHNLDIMAWIMGKDPVEIIGIGGRAWDIPYPEMGDRFSHAAVDFDYGNGVHVSSLSRRENKAGDMIIERVVGTKGYFEANLYGGQRIFGAKTWEASKNIPQCIVEEHRVLLDSVVNNKKINMLRDMVGSTLIAIAGRESTYSGRKLKYDWIKHKSQLSLAPKEWKFGKNPLHGVPVPGKYKLV